MGTVPILSVSHCSDSRSGNISLGDHRQPGLNLHLKLKSPMQMQALAEVLKAHQPQTRESLAGLHYVHFARFLPSWDYSSLWVITVFDGEYGAADNPDAYNESMTSYIMDFVATMGDIFTAILDFVQDAPRLPVHEYPRDFVEFVIKNNRNNVNPWSAYPELTVIDIQSMHGIR